MKKVIYVQIVRVSPRFPKGENEEVSTSSPSGLGAPLLAVCKAKEIKTNINIYKDMFLLKVKKVGCEEDLGNLKNI